MGIRLVTVGYLVDTFDNKQQCNLEGIKCLDIGTGQMHLYSLDDARNIIRDKDSFLDDLLLNTMVSWEQQAGCKLSSYIEIHNDFDIETGVFCSARVYCNGDDKTPIGLVRIRDNIRVDLTISTSLEDTQGNLYTDDSFSSDPRYLNYTIFVEVDGLYGINDCFLYSYDNGMGIYCAKQVSKWHDKKMVNDGITASPNLFKIQGSDLLKLPYGLYYLILGNSDYALIPNECRNIKIVFNEHKVHTKCIIPPTVSELSIDYKHAQNVTFYLKNDAKLENTVRDMFKGLSAKGGYTHHYWTNISIDRYATGKFNRRMIREGVKDENKHYRWDGEIRKGVSLYDIIKLYNTLGEFYNLSLELY